MPPSNEQKFRRLISGQDRRLIATLIRGILRGLSVLYSMAVKIRGTSFDLRWKEIQELPVPVVSVGNITTGGTGKTPVVALVAQLLQQSGYCPGIVSRGYRADESGFNDEKRVLDIQCPGVPHMQNARRADAARQLLSLHPSVNVLILDDGFQHRTIARCLDIVLIDATNPFGFHHLLPRGLLREPLSSLKRAQLVVITRASLVDEKSLTQTEAVISDSAADRHFPLLRSNFEPSGLLDVSGNRHSLAEKNGMAVFLMSGIGNPEAFRRTCELAGFRILGHSIFPDHHHYTNDEISQVLHQSQSCGAALLITTLKDLVKLPPDASQFLALEITVQFCPPEQLTLFQSCLQQSLVGSEGSPARMPLRPMSTVERDRQV